MQSFFKTIFYIPFHNLLTSPSPTQSLLPALFLGDTFYHLATLFSVSQNHISSGLLHLLISLSTIIFLARVSSTDKQRTSPDTRNTLISLNFLHSVIDIWLFASLNFEDLESSQKLSLLVKLSLEHLWRYFILDVLGAGILIKIFYLMMCVKLFSLLKIFTWLDFLIRGKFSYTALLIIIPALVNSLRTKSDSPIMMKEDSIRSSYSRESLFRTGSMATVASLVNKIGSMDTMESPNLSLSRIRSTNGGKKKLAAQPIVESACDLMEESTYDTLTHRSNVKAASANFLPESLATIFESGHTSQMSPKLLEDLEMNDPMRSLPEILPIPNGNGSTGSLGEASVHDNVLPGKVMPYILQNGTTRSMSNEELDWEHRIQAKILNELPEGVVVIDYLGRIRFLNGYMRNTFQCDEKVSFGHLSAKLCEFKFVETSIHINENNIKGISRSTGEDTLHIGQYNDETSSDSRDEFLLKIQKITSLEQLFTFYVKEIESWENNQNCVPTFQTKFYHQLVTDWVPMEVKANLASEAGDQKCLIILLRDTTGRDNKIFALETEKIVYRNNLIASFSHELRTPLNANMAFLEQAIDSSEISPAVKQELIKPALISGKLLSFLINDILDYSQLIVNCLQLKIKPSSLAQTINTVLELFQEKMNQKNLVVKVNIDKDIPKFFYTDHARLIQILINLLSNSIKFTMDGCISITLKRTPADSVIVSVEDDGVGMEPEAQENLRLKLSEERLKDRVNGDSVGVGLGLFISNKLAQLLSPPKKQAKEREGMYDDEGKAGISFWSERNQGSHFFIEIENRVPTVKKEIVEKGSKKGHFGIEDEGTLNDALNEYSTRPFKNTFKLRRGVEEVPESKVLIVDDEVFNIMVIENFCKALKIPTEKAFNGREAVEKLKEAAKETKCPIKIIFMDVNMPVMDGYGASSAIQKMLKEEQIEDVVIIGVTAYVSKDMIDKCYKCGMTEVLNKPLSKGMVMDVLKRHGIV